MGVVHGPLVGGRSAGTPPLVIAASAAALQVTGQAPLIASTTPCWSAARVAASNAALNQVLLVALVAARCLATDKECCRNLVVQSSMDTDEDVRDDASRDVASL